MSNFKRAPVHAGGPGRSSILTSLKAAEMIGGKPVLPAEIVSTILDYLPIPDLMSFARTSKRMLEMVYEDSRWVQRLKVMGVWNEGEARKRFEEAVKMKREIMRIRAEEEGKRTGIGVNGNAAQRKTSTTLFDAGVEEERQRQSTEVASKAAGTSIEDGFETLALSSVAQSSNTSTARAAMLDPEALLNIFSGLKSIRGSARQEYAKIYAALAPFYYDLARSRSHMDPIIFRVYRDPEQQAQMLAHLQIFSRTDWAQGWRQREEKLNTMIGIFENAVLREFEQGYEGMDVDGRMRRYAQVLAVLNGGHACIELFVQKHPMFTDREYLGNSMDCINQASSDGVALEPSRQFLEKLSKKVNEQSDVIDRVFPPGEDVLQLFLDKIAEDILMEYVTPLFDECHERSIPSYLKAVSGLFEQSIRFGASLKPTKNSGDSFPATIKSVLARVFEPHVDLYLSEEFDNFKKKAEAEVGIWESKLSAQDATSESFFMANVSRQADKKDFLSSFKKVVMMPVNVLPSLPISSPFGAAKVLSPGVTANRFSVQASPGPSRPQTPGLGAAGNRSSTPLPGHAPTDELAAKAALMASRLEGIRSLFSIEVALDLTHSAKASIERAALFVRLGGQTGEEAREQCEAIFVSLLQILGNRHVKIGFDKAVDHLSKYNPREVSEHQQGVAPLVTFLELVNVGDLISQMIDVFYEQQLAATKLADRNDFLDPAVKAKKKFEQMLDERVAAGLNKGIDVLMDEVEYLCATLQRPTDYNPLPASDPRTQTFEIGTTQAAEKVVNLVQSHTKMLTGSTDKNMLDVFNQEVGLRLFTAICKHLKRQRISVDGSMRLISDMNLYFVYIRTLKNQDLLEYFKALRELSQIYLIDPKHAKEMAEVIADGDRFHGIFRAEEVYEFAERRADWYTVKKNVERAMYGIGCGIM
ncbi:related to Sls2 protein [Rhynchosporium graminicola]|uniref:Related to Sls2 protein n=1 Tax=Rhynchosporium graminicola TaxID=2792576 RepID=A0A1E1KWJ6_9HELO|nr:related to Sls2 protein [Rhynchosporium commune]